VRDDIFMLQSFAASNLRQAGLDLAQDPFVVTHQTRNCLSTRDLLSRPCCEANAVKLSLQFRRKFYFHVASVGAAICSVKAKRHHGSGPLQELQRVHIDEDGGLRYFFFVAIGQSAG
jgi:hypothetical protein